MEYLIKPKSTDLFINKTEIFVWLRLRLKNFVHSGNYPPKLANTAASPNSWTV